MGLLSAAVTCQGLKDGDLVIMTLRRPSAGGSAHLSSDFVNSLPEERRVFGYVRQAQRVNVRRNEQLNPLVRKYNLDTEQNMNTEVAEVVEAFVDAYDSCELV